MIRLTRINHVPLVLNSDLIEHVEVTPDTVISLTTGQKFVVLENPREIIERVVEFRRSIFEGMFSDPTVLTRPSDGSSDSETAENLITDPEI
jgi:flagellar protein FlbD